jgi:hypothetical protein
MSTLKRKCNQKTIPENKLKKYEITDIIYYNEENLILEKVTNKRVTNDNIMIYTKCNNYYKGSVVNGLFSGKGTLTLTHLNGVGYIGQFKDGKLNGEGTFTYPNGDKYVGQFKDGKRNGQGTITFVNHVKYVKYEGKFKDNEFVQGIMIYKDGSNYNGDFFKGKKHGYGTETFPLNRGFYKGNFKEDKKDGEGSLEFTNGDKYTGLWCNDKLEGKEE